MLMKCGQFTFILGLIAYTSANAVISGNGGLFIQIGSGYYFIETKTYANWFNAYEACRRIGSELITIDTIDEWNAINKYLNDMNIMRQYWTSGTDTAEQGTHIWFSNGERITQNIWAPGQPDNYRNNEHCDALGFVPDSLKNQIPVKMFMNDLSCETRIPFICEASKLQAPQII